MNVNVSFQEFLFPLAIYNCLPIGIPAFVFFLSVSAYVVYLQNSIQFMVFVSSCIYRLTTISIIQQYQASPILFHFYFFLFFNKKKGGKGKINRKKRQSSA